MCGVTGRIKMRDSRIPKGFSGMVCLVVTLAVRGNRLKTLNPKS